MAININPTRINIQSGNSGKSSAGRRRPPSDEGRAIIPAKADVNIIPAPEALQTMIRSAVDSVRNGVFWDRGTIVNLVI